MFSYLWIITGSVVYLIVATGLFLRVRKDRRHAVLFLIVAALGYIPFVGFPFFSAALRQDDSRRQIAALRLAQFKERRGIIDTATGAPKEDRYLNPQELRTLITALAAALPAPTGDKPAPDCYYLYMYAYYLDRPELPLNRKWNASIDMPDAFYTPEGAFVVDPEIQSGAVATQVRDSWRRIAQEPNAPAGLDHCPPPP